MLGEKRLKMSIGTGVYISPPPIEISICQTKNPCPVPTANAEPREPGAMLREWCRILGQGGGGGVDRTVDASFGRGVIRVPPRPTDTRVVARDGRIRREFVVRDAVQRLHRSHALSDEADGVGRCD